MHVTIGTRLGSLEITGLLGKGGMGEVFRARDTKLKREVAIKILPDQFALDPDRVSRFQREAEVLASLNHPNIAGIHSLEEADGSRFLVLELVEGETLAERIRRGTLAVDDALQIAKGICEALEAAHDKGIVHRDLKPANVKITPGGQVKVLDFGLAKALENTPAAGNLSQSPTLSFAATQAGVILGTAAYMSPEQAKGLNTDQRSDIFSFGAVLYELLTGRQGFQGDSVSEVLASILAREPDFSLMPPSLNPRMHALLLRALEKNPRRRWHAIGDLRMEIEAVLADPRGTLLQTQHAPAKKARWIRAIPVLAAVILTAALTIAGMWYFRRTPPLEIIRFPVTLAEGQSFTNTGRRAVAISPDGTQMVYVANLRLYRRAMSELEATPIPGTGTGQGVLSPVFSPDGRSLVFWTFGDNALKRIALSGGAAVMLCAAEPPLGVSWGEDGIVFGQGSKGILRISENGGTPEQLVSVKPGELASNPQVLPDGKAVLYTLGTGVGGDQWDKAQIVVQSLKPGSQPKQIIQNGSDARYVSTGHIIYGFEGALFAVPFDLRRQEKTGGQVAIVEGVRKSNTTGEAQYSVSNTGSLIYIPGPLSSIEAQMTLASMGRKGDLAPLKLPPKSYGFPRVAPKGIKRIAFSTENGRDANVWIYDLAGTAQPRQLTVDGSANRYPVWSADGERVAFQSDREGNLGIWWRRADGNGTAERLTKPQQGIAHIPDSWSPDGQNFSFTAIKGTEGSLWTYSLQERKAIVFAEKAGSLIGWSAFSPDGKWLAYQSNQTGRNQIFVQPFPATGTEYSITAGAHPFWSPLWSPDGGELFYTTGPASMAVVSIKTRPFSFGDPAPVPPGLSNRNPITDPRFWDITPDGKEFVGVVNPDQTPSRSIAATQIQVVVNWFEDLKQRMSAP